MSWHPECYNKKYGTNHRGSPTKWASRCEAGSECIRGGQIIMGQMYYYSNRAAPFGQKGYNPSRADDIFNKLQGQKFGGGDAQTSKDIHAPEVTPEVPAQPLEGVTKEETDRLTALQAVMEKNVTVKVKASTDDTILNSMIQVEDDVTGRVVQTMKKVVGDMMNVTADQVVKSVLDNINSVTVKRIEIQDQKSGEVRDMGLQHKQFPILLKSAIARVNVWMAGPSASGKTTAAVNVAKALKLPFHYTGAVGDPYALLGFKSVNNELVRTAFREAWEHGGIFLWDEVDASDPNALLAFNAALANGNAPFPDGCIDKHKDCILIAAANTWGFGATTEYVGRLKMDAAFLKRFAFLAWDYDDQLELSTAPNKEWTMRVQAIRKKVQAKGLRVLVTPRESYIGAQLLEAGIPQNIVEEMTIRSGMTPEQWAQIK